MYAYMNRDHEVPELEVPLELRGTFDTFWEMRGYIGDADTPMTVEHILHWSAHTYTVMQKFERDFMLSMDRAFRHARSEVVKFHDSRTQINLGDNDRKRL